MWKFRFLWMAGFAVTLYAQGPRSPFRNPEIRLLGAQPGRPRQVVKGAPYTADVSTEISRTLADGNKIHQVVTERLYRDSEGRTRRETSLTEIGVPAPPGGGPQLAFIDDPVAGASYVLDLGAHTATRTPWRSPPANGALRRQFRARAEDFNRKTESLGRETIAGLPADGTRITQTIPAGQIGNTLPIEVVTERWYSPDLQAVILEKRSDPRTGNYIYQWTNIVRAEPPASLFAVPAEFSLSQAPRPGGRGKRPPPPQ
jgi:hypothetical protein